MAPNERALPFTGTGWWTRLEPLLFSLLSAIPLFYSITGQSLWADEGNSVAQAMRPLGEIVRRSAMDIHPPLYYILLHFWTRAFGLSELALRSLSAIAGVILIGLIWAIAHRLWGRGTARIVATLAMLHPFLVYYAQEVRMYIFVALWASVAAYALVRIILREGQARMSLPDVPKRKTLHLITRDIVISPTHSALLLGKWDLLYIFAVAAGMWTHYAFPVLPLTLALIYMGWLYSTRRTLPLVPRVIRLLTDNLAALLLYMPWVPTTLHQIRTWPRPTDVLPLEKGLTMAWQWLAIGPQPDKLAIRWLWVWAVLLVVALWPWRRSTRIGYRRPHWLSWALPVLWISLPIGMMAFLNLFRVAYLKFLIMGLPAFILLISRGMLAPWQAWKRGRKLSGRVIGGLWLVATFLLVVFLQIRLLVLYYTSSENARDDYRGIGRYIEAIASPDDAVLLDAPGQWDVFCYYYDGCDPLQDMSVQPAQQDADLPPVYAIPLERPPQRERVIGRLEDISRRHRKLFVLLWGTDESDPEGIVESWLDAHAYKALDAWKGHLRFLIYSTPQIGQETTISQSLDARLDKIVRLQSFSLADLQVTPGDVLQVRFYWYVLSTPQKRYKVFVQLLGPGDRLIAQRDSEPVGGSAPTTSWRPGDTIADNYGILVPLGTPPGEYRLITGMYDALTGQRIPVTQNGQTRDFVDIPVRVIVKRPPVPPPVDVLPMRYRVNETWGPILLLGYDRYKRGFRHAPDTPIHPGDFLHLTLFWKAREAPRERWRATISIVDTWGNVISSVTDDLAGPTYPTEKWSTGEVVRGEFDLYLSPNAKAGTYGIQIQLWKNDAPVREPTPLGTIEVSTAQ